MHLNTVLVVKDTKDIIAEAGVNSLEICNGHFVHWGAGLLREGDALAGNVVGGAEWHAFANEVVGKVGSDHEGAVTKLSISKNGEE